MEDSTRPIRIVVINGSVRPNNYTSMASAYVVDELRKHPRQKNASPTALSIHCGLSAGNDLSANGNLSLISVPQHRGAVL